MKLRANTVLMSLTKDFWRGFIGGIYLIAVLYQLPVNGPTFGQDSYPVQQSSRVFNHLSDLKYHPFDPDEIEFKVKRTQIPIDCSYMNGVPADYAISGITYIESAVLSLEHLGENPKYMHSRLKMDSEFGDARNGLNVDGDGFPWKRIVIEEFELPMTICPIPCPQICVRLFPQVAIDWAVNRRESRPYDLISEVCLATRTQVRDGSFTDLLGTASRLPTPKGLPGRTPSRKRLKLEHQLQVFIKSHRSINVPELNLDSSDVSIPWERQITSYWLLGRNTKVSLSVMSTPEGEKNVWIGFKLCDGNGEYREWRDADGQRHESFKKTLSHYWLENYIPESIARNVLMDDFRIPEFEEFLFASSEAWVAPSFYPAFDPLPPIVMREDPNGVSSGIDVWVDLPEFSNVLSGDDEFKRKFDSKTQPVRMVIAPETPPRELLYHLAKLKQIDGLSEQDIEKLCLDLAPFHEAVLKCRGKYVQEYPMNSVDSRD